MAMADILTLNSDEVILGDGETNSNTKQKDMSILRRLTIVVSGLREFIGLKESQEPVKRKMVQHSKYHREVEVYYNEVQHQKQPTLQHQQNQPEAQHHQQQPISPQMQQQGTMLQQQQQQLTDAAQREKETRLDMAMVKKDMPGETSMEKSEEETEIDQIISSSKVKNVRTTCDNCQQVPCLIICSEQINVHPFWQCPSEQQQKQTQQDQQQQQQPLQQQHNVTNNRQQQKQTTDALISANKLCLQKLKLQRLYQLHCLSQTQLQQQIQQEINIAETLYQTGKAIRQHLQHQKLLHLHHHTTPQLQQRHLQQLNKLETSLLESYQKRSKGLQQQLQHLEQNTLTDRQRLIWCKEKQLHVQNAIVFAKAFKNS